MNFEIDNHSFERSEKIKVKLNLTFFFDAIEVYETIEEFYYGKNVRYYNFNDLRVLG